MSEQGWHDFQAADVDDWVVLHGGATAVFRVASLKDAVRFAGAAADAPGIAGAGVLFTLADTRVTVRLNRDIWKLESQHIQIARTISAVAREHGVTPDRSAPQEVQIAIASKSETTDVGFWRAVLGYQPMADDNAVDPLGHGSTVWMQEIDASKSLRHAMHIDVSVAREHVQARLDAALAAGGRIVDDSHAPVHWTLADRAGNRVCICAWPDAISDSKD